MSDTELLTTRDALSSIADEWRALAEEVGNVFVTPEWLVTWLEHGVERVTPFVVTRRGDDGRLCGVLPLVLVAGRRPVLRFAGASVGDWFGPVIKTGEEAAFIRGAAAILGRESGSWSMLALTNVDAEAAWPSQLSDAMPRRTFVGGTSTGMPYIDLSLTTWDQYLKGRSSKLRAQLGRSMRVLRRDHDVTFRRTKSPSDVARDVETLFDLHNRRWNKRGGSGIPPVTHSFHERFANVRCNATGSGCGSSKSTELQLRHGTAGASEGGTRSTSVVSIPSGLNGERGSSCLPTRSRRHSRRGASRTTSCSGTRNTRCASPTGDASCVPRLLSPRSASFVS